MKHLVLMRLNIHIQQVNHRFILPVLDCMLTLPWGSSFHLLPLPFRGDCILWLLFAPWHSAWPEEKSVYLSMPSGTSCHWNSNIDTRSWWASAGQRGHRVHITYSQFPGSLSGCFGFSIYVQCLSSEWLGSVKKKTVVNSLQPDQSQLDFWKKQNV